jgi:hypothetical protein
MKNKDKILEIIKTRNIIQIIHFTKKQNIGSIIKNGLLSINELKKRNINYLYNDPERKDNWDNAISLSITNKNLMLFNRFKERQKLTDNDFVEIKINPTVIAEEECIFCDTNAANHTFEPYRQDENELNNLKIWPAFEGLFKRVIERHKYPGGKINRSSHQLNETTCPQAEICLIGSITPDKFINYDELNKFTNGQ